MIRTKQICKEHQLFHDGGGYHIEKSPLICTANQWTGFYMIGTSVKKELKVTLFKNIQQSIF